MANVAHAPESPLSAEASVELGGPAGFEELTIDTSAAAAASPARQMQNTLGREFSAVDQVERWSARQTVGFVICTCGAFWTAVYFGIAALIG